MERRRLRVAIVLGLGLGAALAVGQIWQSRDDVSSGRHVGEGEDPVTGAVPAGPEADGVPKADSASTRASEARAPATGRWVLHEPRSAQPVLTAEQKALIERLEAIGYAGGSHRAGAMANVTRHDREKASPGFNFHTSGHAPEAFLLDMQGTVLHRWAHDYHAIWPGRDIPAKFEFWRRAHLFPNGDLLAVFEGQGIIKLDKDSNLIWANPVRAHHDLQVLDDGSIYVLTRKARLVPHLHPERPVLEDFVSVLNADGEEQRRVSLVECFLRSEFDSIRLAGPRRSGDIFHTNTLEVLDGSLASRAPWLREGIVLTSMLFLDCIAFVDLDAERVVMAWQGSFKRQHDPRILPNGNLLLFDNRGVEGRSRVLELDPISRESRWLYEGSQEAPFYSETCGTAQRLFNGNTLITESDAGRALEVTSEGEIVWEFHNPHRAGENGEYVALLPEVVRLPADFPVHWARGPQD